MRENSTVHKGSLLPDSVMTYVHLYIDPGLAVECPTLEQAGVSLWLLRWREAGIEIPWIPGQTAKEAILQRAKDQKEG